MTNVLLLTQFDGAQTVFEIARNSDWLDGIFFAAPGSPAQVSMVGQITTGQNVITLSTTFGLAPGMSIGLSPGIPNSAFVGAVSSSTQITMVNAAGQVLNATQTNVEANLTFFPVPLDLTGIAFRAQVRPSAGSGILLLTAQTQDGTMLNGGTSGVLNFNVPQPTIESRLTGSSYVVDILAIADNHTINLFQKNGPASLTVGPGVTAVS